jgi:hypothetical protein
MPEIQAEGLDVSAEEERYLRGAFRRFALPYLAATIAMGGVAVAAVSLVSTEPGGGAAEELQSLVAEAASLREAIAAVRGELRDHAEGEAGRLTQLEAGFARLESVESGGASATADLVARLDHAHQRISALEGRLSEIQSARDAAPPEPPGWAPASPSLP